MINRSFVSRHIASARQVLSRLLTGSSDTNDLFKFSRKDFDNRQQLASDGFPIPPRNLWHSGAESFEDWMAAGREHYESMRSILKSQGYQAADGSRVLDFGCSSGRTVRLWKDDVGVEVWGCEIDRDRVKWCQTNLGERFRFVQTTTNPHLPFDDRFFDLIYAGSVFTHIRELDDFWLLELRRALRPGGYLFITLHDENTWKLVREGQGPTLEYLASNGPLSSMRQLDHDFVAIGSGDQSQAFYRSDYFVEKAGRYFDVLELRPAARGYQSAIVLKRTVN